MTFYSYMMEYHLGSLRPSGDLADDMRNDPDFPRYKASKKAIRNYLISRGAIDDCLETFEECWADFRGR